MLRDFVPGRGILKGKGNLLQATKGGGGKLLYHNPLHFFHFVSSCQCKGH